jgi:hypothetical protein
MINQRRQENGMARRVKVASRAVRRGRRLRARESQLPPAGSELGFTDEQLEDERLDADADEGIPEVDDEPAVDTPDTRRLTPIETLLQDDQGAEKAPLRSAAPGARFSRPSAPLLDFSAPPVIDEPPAVEEPPPVIEEVAEAPIEIAPRPRFSRPTAPVLDFSFDAPSASSAEPEEDPNATTLVSSSDAATSSQPPPSPVNVVDAATDEGAVEESDEDDEREANLIAMPSIDDSDFAPMRRPLESSLAPVVDDADDAGPSFLTLEEERRRRALRRGVGAAVIGAGLITLVLVARATLGGHEPAESAPVRAAAAQPAGEEPAGEQAPAAEPQKPAAAPTADIAAVPAADSSTTVPSGDYDTLSDQTVKLLSNRKFEEAIPLAQKLIELRPKDSLGYRCLGSAYQDLGRYHDAQQVYTQCATHATQGEVRECTALGGRKLKK